MSKSTSVSTVARVNGIDLAYQEFGTGSPLILLHGLTHYDINMSPTLAQTVIPFLDG